MFFGLTHDSGRAQLARAVLEGVAFAFADGQQALQDGGARIDNVSLVGGGARSALWAQILADTLGRPLQRHSGAEVGAALGAARLARLARSGESIADGVHRAALARPLRTRRAARRDAGAAPPALPRFVPVADVADALTFQPVESAMNRCFESIAPIAFEGPQSDNPLAFHHYERDRIVLGKRMEDQLRFAVCYWHSFAWNGFDVFGYDGSFQRPWHAVADPWEAALLKCDNAFDFFSRLGAPFYCFHDRDVAPEGATPKASVELFRRMVDVLARKQSDTGMKLLWGTANLFSHRRFIAGAATNPNPEVFALAALQVKEAMEATLKLGGANYVLWGGREGYETLLNTDLKRELAQLGRFMQMVVEHKHKIGFKGTILIEPKPREPTKHQYDFDVATVFGFLHKNGLDKEIKVNIEANHATLAGHSFEHEIATAQALGIFGSIDMNRGDMQCGWDTDQFPNNLADMALAMYQIQRGGGFSTGGLNFDAKVRRPSIDPVDMFHGHVGAMDLCARALLAAERMIQDGGHARFIEERYAGWAGALGQQLLGGPSTLAGAAEHALQRNVDELPQSGRQEWLENWFNRFGG